MELLRKQPPTVAVSRELQLPAGDTAIRFVLRRDPSRGQLQLTTADSPVQISAKGPLQSFTQADINEEDRSPPSIITNKGLVLDENSAKTIRTLQLSATDQDSEASQLQFKVTQQPQLGHLEHVASPGTRISSFSQADLASGSIQYIHTSDVEKHTDAFTFSVSDGTNEHLPDGSAPSAHAEFYLLPDPYEVSRRKTRTAPRGSDPTYNELVSTIHFLPPLLVSWNHGMGQAGRAHSGHLVPPPSSSRAIPEHVAQDCVQMVLGYHR
ncbi:extracellular matrix organizing protein FRAS1-like isoform X3 [Poecile atricapillus]|uniref:extracellular matrix organizing protein FRAS1-like isoform X3 n=1 Tax=Poecile atricapillus TaxID=48891 RepID=UPI002738F3A6|nr:extracellular matrix organizing protein FRAS1-like isoform X3 [Poecile atricapillus]